MSCVFFGRLGCWVVKTDPFLYLRHLSYAFATHGNVKTVGEKYNGFCAGKFINRVHGFIPLGIPMSLRRKFPRPHSLHSMSSSSSDVCDPLWSR